MILKVIKCLNVRDILGLEEKHDWNPCKERHSRSNCDHKQKSAAGTVGCCHLEVFVWILSGSQDRVPLMTEHNEKATQKKKDPIFASFFHIGWFCASASCRLCRDTVILTMPPLWLGAMVAEDPGQHPLLLPPEPRGQQRRWLNAHRASLEDSL